jgi:primosomal protein N' (replication factor Y)
MAAVEGTPAALEEALSGLPPSVEVLGPVELEPTPGPGAPAEVRERALLRVPRTEGRALAATLHAAQAARTARKAAEPVRVRLDPVEIG